MPLIRVGVTLILGGLKASRRRRKSERWGKFKKGFSWKTKEYIKAKAEKVVSWDASLVCRVYSMNSPHHLFLPFLPSFLHTKPISFSSPLKCLPFLQLFETPFTALLYKYHFLSLTRRRNNMHLQHFSLVAWFPRVMVFVLLTFLVCGELKEESSVVGLSSQTPNMVGNQKQREKQQKQPFDVFYTQKRKVPNASDPLHN